MKQRLGLAQALLNCDNLLILDEPLVGLDLFGREIVKDVIKSKAKKGVSILFSDHNLNEVEKISDRIVCIDKGKKFFDGKFVPLPKYHIKIKNTNNVNIDKNLFSQFNDEILFKDDDEVIIKNKEHINFILNFFYKNQIFVEDILVEEDSIKKFFNDGEEVYDK